MGYDRVIKNHYDDLNNLSGLLSTSINAYRLLVSSAAELNTVSYAKKGAVKDAIDRVEDLGDIIDDLIKVIKKCEVSYAKYCIIKNDVIVQNTGKEYIETEIDTEINYHNNQRDGEE